MRTAEDTTVGIEAARIKMPGAVYFLRHLFSKEVKEMWDRKKIKSDGKTAFKANYWKSVGVSLILLVITGNIGSFRFNLNSGEGGEQSLEWSAGYFTDTITPAMVTAMTGIIAVAIIAALLLSIFLLNPLKVGCYEFFKKNLHDPGTGLDMVTDGFSPYKRNCMALFLTDLYISLWTLLFIIPGIVKSYSYRLVPYILKDEPDLAPKEVIEKSKKMMEGHKWNAFVYDLSFIGWEILGAVTFGIVNIFWTGPYKSSADAALYYAIRNNL